MNTIQPKPATGSRSAFALFAGGKIKAMLLALVVCALQPSAKSQELQGLYGQAAEISVSGTGPLSTDPARYHLNGVTGELWVKNTDGEWVKSPWNLKGSDGTNGTNGNNGNPGRGITGATINGGNHLIVTYSDNTTADAGSVSANLATVATSGSYNDLTGRPSLATVASSGAYSDLTGRPSIPAAQVNSDWSASSGVAQILNKPSLANVATTGAYNDLTGKPTLSPAAASGSYLDLTNRPTIPSAQVNSDWNAVSGIAQILNKPTLGTAASQASTSFATSAQGVKADSAVQTSTAPLVVTGTNIALSPATTSTAGSMSAADKAKLDGFKLTAGSATALTILSLASQDVTVTLASAMPNITYIAVATVQGSTTILGNVVVQGIKSQTTTAVVVTIKNTGLSTIANGISINVIAYTPL